MRMLCAYYKGEAFVKRKDLIRKLTNAGFVFYKHGGTHDKYIRGKDVEIIPRHSEINEHTARNILKRWDIK